MASEKNPSNPSIYSDRSTIGSSEELDEYGVWVKSEPQDLSSEGNMEGLDEGEAEDSFLDIPDEDLFEDADAELEEPLSFDDFAEDSSDDLVSEEEDLLNASPEESILDVPSSDDDLGIVSFEDDEDFLDDIMDDIQDDIQDDITQEDSPVDILADDGGVPPDTSLEDSLFFDEDEDTTANISIESNEADPVDQEQNSAVEAENQKGAEEGRDGFSEISLEDFLDDEGNSQDGYSAALVEEESAPPVQEALSVQLLSRIVDELSGIRTEILELKKEMKTIHPESRAETKEETGTSGGFFDEDNDEKIALTGDELDNILHSADFTEEMGSDVGMDEGLGELFSDDASASDFPIDMGFDEDGDGKPEEDTPFVDDILEATDGFELPDELSLDSDEEAFALDDAGSALEDFAEEPEGFDDSFDTLEESPVEDDFLELDSANAEDMELGEDLELEAGDIELGEEFEAEDIELDEDLELEASPEMLQLMETGAEPMTEAPDDTSYLDDELFDVSLDDDFDQEEDQLDLTNAIIDEPDLGYELTENPVIEPVIEDISLELEDHDIQTAWDSEASFDDEEDFASEDSLELDLDDAEPFALDTTPDIAIPDDFVVPGDENGSITGIEADAADTLGSFQEEETETASFDAVQEEALIPAAIREELRTVLTYMDQLLESLPEDKIEEFAKSEYFDTYKKLFEELGLA